MKYFRKNCTDDYISFDDYKNNKIIEEQIYQDYLRKSNIIYNKEKMKKRRCINLSNKRGIKNNE